MGKNKTKTAVVAAKSPTDLLNGTASTANHSPNETKADGSTAEAASADSNGQVDADGQVHTCRLCTDELEVGKDLAVRLWCVQCGDGYYHRECYDKYMYHLNSSGCRRNSHSMVL